jgi:D-xylose 1-dehydrogenase (NADP+, D-xylono-1,5-lactone-forming)
VTVASPVRLGILGTGDINRRFLPGVRATDAVSVVAVGSRTQAAADAFVAEHHVPTAHGTYEALLADPEVEAVYICVPNSMHHEWTMRALAAGKHVLCEKPYSPHPEHVVEAFEAADRAGLVLTEAFMWRHSPQTTKLRELLPQIGTLQVVRASFSFPLTWDVDIRLRPDLEGGALMDVGCYTVSGARLVAGADPERIDAEMVVGPTGVDTLLMGTLRFPNGVLGQIVCGFTTDHMSLEAIGTQGTIQLPDPWHARAGLLFLNGEEVRVEQVSPYRCEAENFAAAIRGSAPALLGRADALGQSRAIDALYRSARGGQTVSL